MTRGRSCRAWSARAGSLHVILHVGGHQRDLWNVTQTDEQSETISLVLVMEGILVWRYTQETGEAVTASLLGERCCGLD